MTGHPGSCCSSQPWGPDFGLWGGSCFQASGSQLQCGGPNIHFPGLAAILKVLNLYIKVFLA